MAVLMTMSAPSASAGGGCRGVDFQDRQTTEVRMGNNCYFPQVARVDAGQSLTFLNEDPAEHTVTGLIASFGSYGKIAGGDSVAYTFSRPGVYPYFCFLHNGMTGTIVVGDGGSGDPELDFTTAVTAAGSGGTNATTVAAIAAAAALGGAALSMVATRLFSRKAL
ncbi:MAG: cupredoxin domain-containing protein [Chloroflexi bacterium]|nr:cupredoxin domain-containing protein [Chloroflexota bacterium]